jgi:large subunit ribosomal protein L3
MITLLGRKKGMGGIFDESGRHTPVTVLEVGPCPVVQVKTPERDGYSAVQIGFEAQRPKSLTKPAAGHFKRAGVEPLHTLHEFRYSNGDLKEGDVINVSHFKPGDIVIVVANSKGRGFAGVIKRHNFGSPPATHGTHEIFRGTGSIGQHSYPARVWPGMKMPGRMGGKQVTVKGLLVVDVDTDNGLLMVRGAVPGAPGGLVSVRKAG